MFRINEVVQRENVPYRILSLLPEEVVWILVHDDSAFPSLIAKSELAAAIENEMLTRAEDPFEYLAYLTPEKGTTAQRKRDQNYELIQPLAEEPLFYVPKIRSALINKIIETKGSTKQTLYRLLRRYWQRGQTANALIPDYMNSGNKGGKRIAGDKKLGRPRKYLPGVGALVDEHIEKMFRRTVEKYLLTEKKHSLAYAHRKFKTLYETYYPETLETEIPTYWQMVHFYNREYGQVEKIQKRSNRIEYDKDIQPLTSTANTQALGPGSRFEIDATIADIYLVSDSDRGNIVGRPIVYIVIDVFSRMVAGLYIGFENPSYVAAMQALSISMTSKVEYCKQYGVDIDDEDWPVVGLPGAILADRGELLGHQIESLERNFSVRIENTPPYRGDAKGIVERCFKTLQADFKPFAPGVVTGTKIKKRGGKDYRLDAKLTVHDFTEIVLASVLYHNRFHTLEKYDRDIDMPADLPMVPLALWNWGLQHRTGRLMVVSEDALRVSLLPRTKATFSELGVRVFGLFYTSQEIVQHGWLHRAKEATRPESLEAAYDPRTANYIYLFPRSDRAEYWVCNLAPRSRNFSGCSFWDVWQVSAEQKKTMAESKLVSERHRRELDSSIESKIKAAENQQPATEGMSNSERIASISDNRKKAKAEERQESAYSPPKPKNGKPAEVIPLTEQELDCSFPDFIDELFEEED